MLEAMAKSTIRDAAQKLTGLKKRAFMAKVTEDYFNGSARQAETHFDWNRNSVQRGLPERRTDVVCLDHYPGRGRRKTEARLPRLAADIRDLVDPHTQADPQLKPTFADRSPCRPCWMPCIRTRAMLPPTCPVIKRWEPSSIGWAIALKNPKSKTAKETARNRRHFCPRWPS